MAMFLVGRFMKWKAVIIVTFFNPRELTKIVLQSSTQFYDVKLKQLGQGTEPKKLFLFSA